MARDRLSTGKKCETCMGHPGGPHKKVRLWTAWGASRVKICMYIFLFKGVLGTTGCSKHLYNTEG